MRAFATTIQGVAEEVLGKHKSQGLPGCVFQKITKLKIERDETKKKFTILVEPDSVRFHHDIIFS